jgi:hypothetical protein
MKFESRALARASLAACVLTACADATTAPRTMPDKPSLAVDAEVEPSMISGYLVTLNDRLAAAGANVVATEAELLVSASASAKTPRIVFANDRALRLATRWVPRDLRRLATDATLTYSVFSPFANASVGGPAEAAFDAGFATWNSVSCSKLVVRKKALIPGQFPSFIFTGLFPPADINMVGFLPGAIFDQVFGPIAGPVTIGVTITFAFIEVGPNGPVLDENGNPILSDIDGDGRFDTAFAEIWFNDSHQYATNGTPNRIDMESVALHEQGHALELAHFGKLALDPKTGKLHVSPRALMNAAYLGIQRAPLGTDNAAYCGNYASWQ